MRLLQFFFVFLFCAVSAQKVLPFDSLKLKETRDMFADDYGNLYLYKNKDFSFTKYDSLGRQMGKMMLTVPFKVQGVQNPLSIALFSENAQEMKFVDQNLNEIQRLDFKQKFGFIKHAYAEDLQQVWLIDESTKRLLQYNFRNDITINSYPYTVNIDEIIDLLVFENRLYILSKNTFRVFNLKFEKLFEAPVEKAKRFRRENENILIITKTAVFRYIQGKDLLKLFEDPETQIVDKNSLAYFEIKDNKLYLYSLENLRKAKPQKSLEELEKTKQELEEEIEKLEKEKAEKGDILKIIEEISNVESFGI
ncbi:MULTISPECIES: hypothetical protein [Chryseobacterium]|uniref:Uncharacterized protein n=1 Tax=Chryseobacterium taihuense TaxID=1141221 RepID=A0A4V6ID44_9FLAO|nr:MULTISPECIES: hypothetical protein [Chryseobacterium]QQV01351.1 hypothetical protein I6I61_09545 [Chryseobacterium sp. FDAARGOS 1104]VFB02054.1 Uncharacterised protein [Chryseobacterium taihuense]